MPFKSVADEMHKFKQGNLHSGSPTGKVVTNPKQAIAISLSEERKAGKHDGQSPAPFYGGAARGSYDGCGPSHDGTCLCGQMKK